MLNKDRILQGTVYKQMASAHEVLMENTIDDAVNVFYQKLSGLSASEIVESSNFIFDEPTKSMDLYESVIKSNCLPFFRYTEELDKLNDYMESHKENLDNRFVELHTYLTEKVKEVQDLYVIETKTIMDSEDPVTLLENVNLFTDILYKATTDKETDYREILESVAENMPDHSVILHSAMVSSELGLEPMILNSMRNVYTENAGIENNSDWSVCLETNMIMEKMMNNSVIAENVNLSRNYNYNKSFKDIAYESPIEIMGDMMIDHVKVISEDMSAFEAVNEMFSKETIQHILEEDASYDEYEVLCRKLNIYETAMDFLMVESELSEDPDHLPPSKSDFMESFRSNFNLPENMSINESLEYVIEACSMIEAEKEFYEYSADGKPSPIISKLAGYNEEDEENRKTVSKKVMKVAEDNALPTGKPKIPKKSLLERIQHGAMDLDAKMKGLRSKGKQVAMNIKNTGKAVLKVPSNLVNGWKDMIAKWDAMDDLRREEFIARPGFRKHYFKGLTTAITYGGAAYANPLLVPIVWMCRKISKQKNMRIRNELTNQLSTELKVIDAKIEDASRKEDNKEKYELMRIRDKLDQERTRVIANSKYV